jgi:hypothetical protein
MSQRADISDIAWAFGSYCNQFEHSRARVLYNWLLEQWRRLGRSPTHLAMFIDEPDLPSGSFKSFPRMRKKFEAAEWGDLAGFALKFMRPDRDFKNYGFFDWSMHAAIHRFHDAPRIWVCDWSIFARDIEVNEDTAATMLLEFARKTVDRYGYLQQMRRGGLPSGYTIGLGSAAAQRTEDEVWNVGGFAGEFFKHVLLRDIYPFNFLTRPYLDLIVEGKTLEQWILSESGRGVLERLNDTVTTWRPVIANIPAIREALFSAGIVYYWRFFDSREPMFRDFSKPWKPPKEIPKMFRADFCKGLDPRLTR